MTDYIAQLASAHRFMREEAERCANNLRNETTTSDGVIRWNSNNNIPPVECVALAAHIGLPVDVAKCTSVRDTETDQFIAEYRLRMRNYKPSREEQFEMRAAFGPGKTVVNVITGQKFRT